jgi:hypothetical protein
MVPTKSVMTKPANEPMPFDHRQESDPTDLALCTASVVVATLRDAGRLTSIPYLQDAAGLALEIIYAIQVRAS